MIPQVAGESAADRLMKYVHVKTQQCFTEGTPEPTEAQVAIVLHALADHTAIMEALKHRPDPTSPWPEATSVSRWFHDVADNLEYRGL